MSKKSIARLLLWLIMYILVFVILHPYLSDPNLFYISWLIRILLVATFVKVIFSIEEKQTKEDNFYKDIYNFNEHDIVAILEQKYTDVVTILKANNYQSTAFVITVMHKKEPIIMINVTYHGASKYSYTLTVINSNKTFSGRETFGTFAFYFCQYLSEKIIRSVVLYTDILDSKDITIKFQEKK